MRSPLDQDISTYRKLLLACVRERQLRDFYPHGSPRIEEIAKKATRQVPVLAQRWRIGPTIASDIVKLALYDVIVHVDDRWIPGNTELLDDLDELPKEVLPRRVLQATRSHQLNRPILVITVLHNPEWSYDLSNILDVIEHRPEVFDVVEESSKILPDLVYPHSHIEDSVAYQFVEVGKNFKTLNSLRRHVNRCSSGKPVDYTINFEHLARQMRITDQPVQFTRQLWTHKLLLGFIDSSYRDAAFATNSSNKHLCRKEE
ncbi:uncharacterized protein PV07_10381 [Cladophialophora immunda]|uniref:Uncharacterized protein n=1 Tax=Cladophialophora immunda TaxID=569365 RepID=A0A0D2CMB1_9EURO|nr:uncharacterized protein PV07_10381 [Cladophialophora immunda]KIW24679.1 hypothetical protein PV07_10381 [Cladophialophora immunda]